MIVTVLHVCHIHLFIAVYSAHPRALCRAVVFSAVSGGRGWVDEDVALVPKQLQQASIARQEKIELKKNDPLR